MSNDIGPGDWVERLRPHPLMSAGSIWQVAEVKHLPGFGGCPTCHDETNDGIRLIGIPDPEEPWGHAYCLCAFRPIYRPKSEIIQALKQPVPELEPA